MFLRCKVRRKDGKQHRYWSVVENTRVAGGRVVQRHVLYLGEINDTQELAWRRSIEVLEEGATHARAEHRDKMRCRFRPPRRTCRSCRSAQDCGFRRVPRAGRSAGGPALGGWGVPRPERVGAAGGSPPRLATGRSRKTANSEKCRFWPSQT